MFNADLRAAPTEDLGNGESCPWCNQPATRAEFMDQWDPVVNGRWLLRYRCTKAPCRNNEHEGWFSVAIQARLLA